MQGTAGEFSNQTQISSSSVTNCGTTTNVTPVDITLPFASADYAERFEGHAGAPADAVRQRALQLGRFGQVV